MAIEIARNAPPEIPISPWDALLLAVRQTAAKVFWCEMQLQDALTRTNKVNKAETDDEGRQDTPEVRYWLAEARTERKFLAAGAKHAIDAGVAERLVRQVELEGRLVVEALTRALDAITPALAPEARRTALEAAYAQLEGSPSTPGPVDTSGSEDSQRTE